MSSIKIWTNHTQKTYWEEILRIHFIIVTRKEAAGPWRLNRFRIYYQLAYLLFRMLKTINEGIHYINIDEWSFERSLHPTQSWIPKEMISTILFNWSIDKETIILITIQTGHLFASLSMGRLIPEYIFSVIIWCEGNWPHRIK